MAVLDLNKIPTIENSIGWLAFNHLQKFPLLNNRGDITLRIYGCSRFLYFTVDEKQPFFVESAYLRAALNEFVSISEMLKASTDQEIKKLTIENSDLPLLHFFKLLREVNFHLNSPHHSITTNEVNSFNTVTGKIEDEVFTLSHTVIDNLDISIFNNSKNIKHYDLKQITEITTWVRNNQYKWGIFHILDLALRQYCYEIEKRYS